MPLNEEAPEETERRRRAALDDRDYRKPDDRDDHGIGRAHPPRDVEDDHGDATAAERIGHAHSPTDPDRDPDEEVTQVGYRASELANGKHEDDEGELGDEDIVEEIDLDDFADPDDLDGR